MWPRTWPPCLPLPKNLGFPQQPPQSLPALLLSSNDHLHSPPCLGLPHMAQTKGRLVLIALHPWTLPLSPGLSRPQRPLPNPIASVSQQSGPQGSSSCLNPETSRQGLWAPRPRIKRPRGSVPRRVGAPPRYMFTALRKNSNSQGYFGNLMCTLDLSVVYSK